VHRPPAVDELKLARRDEALHGLLLRGRLLGPPALEEGLLDVDELAVGRLEQPIDRRGDDGVHIGVLDGVI
jgi:hypothetical protein